MPPRVSSMVLAVAAVHLLTTPLFFGDGFRSALKAGVLFSVSRDPDEAASRSSAFWYATAGLLLAFIGALSRKAEGEGRQPPRWFASALTGLGFWGVLLDPKGGFWLFFPLAFAARRARTAELPSRPRRRGAR